KKIARMAKQILFISSFSSRSRGYSYGFVFRFQYLLFLINMKARYSVTAVVTMRDRGGEQLWNTSHWMFTRRTPGQGYRIQREKSCTRVDCSTLMGALRTLLTGGKDNRRWRWRRWGTG